MKLKLFTLIAAIAFFAFSCSDDDSGTKNREADIESFSFASDVLVNIAIEDAEISAIVKNVDIAHVAPVIKVSEGATVTPASGVAQDFSDGKQVTYTVTSEDGNNKKVYTVRVTDISEMISYQDENVIKFIYDFEEWGTGGTTWKYPALRDLLWQSANGAIALAKLGNVDEYPTSSTTDAHNGSYAAKLETMKGGTFFGHEVTIFSGSLFRGKFELNTAEILKSIKFGQIHPKEFGKPKTFSGYYKYTPGEIFTSPEGNIQGKTDEFSLYAVMFRVAKGSAGQNEYLNGDNILTSDKVVATAILEDKTPKSEFTHFSIDFTYKNNQELNYDQYNYKVAIVFASSTDGDNYRGAVGSKLIVDDVVLECTPIK